MDAADQVIWRYADESGTVPMRGLTEMPTHIRDGISRWLRRQATPCPHSIAVATTGVVFRIVGRPDAWCATCAAESEIAALMTTCVSCARVVDESGRLAAFTLAGHAMIFGAWCATCWDEGEAS